MGKNNNKNKNQGQSRGGQQQAQEGGASPQYNNKAGIKAQVNTLIKDKKFDIGKNERYQNRDMFQTAKNPGDVKVYLDNQPAFFHNLQQLCVMKVDDIPVVKANTVVSAAMPHITLTDLKLNVFGPIEDQLYGGIPMLVKNIRRGNTVLKIDGGEKGVKYSFGRKGLEKFFDVRYEMISPEHRYDDRALENEILHMEKNYILAAPFQACLGGYQVEIIKTLKANGENVQVSYNADAEGWIICSKNVALIARNAADVERYKDDRFGFAKEMAVVWFEKLAEMKREGQDVDELTKQLNGMSLIGEYVGHQDHQHLVKYSRTTIIFYAAVDNNSSDTCIPCQQAWAFFKKWNLDCVKVLSLGVFTDYDKMCDVLCTAFKDVSKSEIAEDEEGNVLYFVKKDPKGEQPDTVLSLAKLKTLEYRLFRKMREKLRGFYANDGEKTQALFNDKVKKFISESKELCDKHELPRPLEYYIGVFKAAFIFIGKDFDVRSRLLAEKYVTFSEELLVYFNETEEGKAFGNNKEFFYSDVLDQQKNIAYGEGISFEHKLAAVQAPKEIIFQEEKKSNPSPVQETKKEEELVICKRRVLIVIPFGTPCSGKSFIWDAWKKQIEATDGWTCDEVSSDGIRAQQMKKLMDAQPNLTRDQAFDNTAKTGPKLYDGQLQKLLTGCDRQGLGDTHVIFLDKNHPTNAINKTVNLIVDLVPHGVVCKRVYLVPEVTQNELIPGYPVSSSFLAQVLARGQSRDVHDTIDNSNPIKMMEIQMLFIGMLKNAVYDKHMLEQSCLDAFLRVPLTDNSMEVPAEVTSALFGVINGFRGMGKTDHKVFTPLLQKLADHKELLTAKIDVNQAVKKCFEQVKQIFAGVEVGSPVAGAQVQKQQVQQEQSQMVVNPQAGKRIFIRQPIYLGVNLEADKGFAGKLTKVFLNAFNQAGEPKEMIEEFRQNIPAGKNFQPFQLPASHHVTTCFVGGNKKKASSELVSSFKEGEAVEVDIRAVIYIPDEIVIGVTFPKISVENEFPHVTLMVSKKFKPVESSAVLQATCRKGGPFFEAYEAARSNVLPAKNAGIHTADNTSIPKHGSDNEVVFVLLRDPVKFDGVTKAFA